MGILAYPKTGQKKELKVVIKVKYKTSIRKLKGLCPIRVMSNFDFFNPRR